MPLYFAYGSNLLLSQIRERTGNKNLKPIFIAYIENAKLIFPRPSKNQKDGVASFEHSNNSKVWGAVFELNDEEIKRLNEYEGYEPGGKDNAYEQKEIEVVKLDGSKVKVVTYIANKLGNFKPSKQYMEKIIKGAKECGLPEEYIEELKKIEMNEE